MGPSKTLALAFVMDPIGAIDVEKDTTFLLMLEAQRRGHRVLYLEQKDLSVDDGRVLGRVSQITLRREQGRHAELQPPRTVALDDDVDVVFQRKDPPVDWEYTIATQMLALCRRAIVLNRPASILAFNENDTFNSEDFVLINASSTPTFATETWISLEIPLDDLEPVRANVQAAVMSLMKESEQALQAT